MYPLRIHLSSFTSRSLPYYLCSMRCKLAILPSLFQEKDYVHRCMQRKYKRIRRTYLLKSHVWSLGFAKNLLLVCFPRYRANHLLSLCVTGQRISEPERGETSGVRTRARRIYKKERAKTFLWERTVDPCSRCSWAHFWTFFLPLSF